MQKICLCFTLLLALSGCGKKTMPTIKEEINKPTKISLLRQFRAEIEGVECEICAQDVVDMVKKLEGVSCADFVRTGTDYEHGYIRFYYDVSERNLDLQALDAMLQKQGFELSLLRGSFYLEPFSADGKKFVALNDEIAMPFSYSNNIELLKKMILMRPDKLFAEGSIKKDAQEGTYYFTLLGQG